MKSREVKRSTRSTSIQRQAVAGGARAAQIPIVPESFLAEVRRELGSLRAEFQREFGSLHVEIGRISRELVSLRRPQSSATNLIRLHALYAAIHAVVKIAPFTAKWLLEYEGADDEQEARLRQAIIDVLGSQATANGLSRLLIDAPSRQGNYQLEVVKLRHRDGRLFRVTRDECDGNGHIRHNEAMGNE